MIIVTGGSGGVGRAILPYLSGRVFALYNTHPVEKGYKINIENPDEIKQFVKLIRPSQVTLIHLAAVNIDGLVLNYQKEWWDKVMSVNLTSNYLLTQALLPTMISDQWGRIIHISSIGVGNIGTVAYSTAKSALYGLSKVLAKEYAKFSITSNILQLGYFGVGLFNEFTDERKKEALKKVPTKKAGNPLNIVNAIDMIMKSDYINGAVIQIDGGI